MQCKRCGKDVDALIDNCCNKCFNDKLIVQEYTKSNIFGYVFMFWLFLFVILGYAVCATIYNIFVRNKE